jgi:hypothetical protein
MGFEGFCFEDRKEVWGIKSLEGREGFARRPGGESIDARTRAARVLEDPP